MTDTGIEDTIVVVEDDALLRASYIRILRDAGYAVVGAERAEAALVALAKTPDVAVILSDIGLPGIDGLSLLKQLREGRPDVPVVMMTGAPDMAGAIRAVEYGAFRYLTKPIRAAELLEVVRQGLGARRFSKLQRDAVSLHAQLTEADQGTRTLQHRFNDALNGLWMAYQPIVDFPTRRIVAFEALLRTSAVAMVSPAQVFDAAERLGRVHELGRMVRGRVAADVALLDPGTPLFVNLHPHDLFDDDLLDEDSPLGMLASRVVLEVTERAPTDHIPDLKGRLAKLSDRGFRIALDDLGAGYAGLVSFTQLEPHVVKLDMALTRNIHTSNTKQKLVGSMLALCADLDIMAIAEGVETHAEREVLSYLGCRFFQGFLFARPAAPFCAAHFEASHA